jgi:hypothetical protein
MAKILISALVILLTSGVCGCQPETDPAVEGNAVLMTVDSEKIREDEFRRAYRVFRAAYGAEPDEPAAVERAAMLRFIQQWADQLVLMAHARDIGVVISDEALNKAIDAIRKDYPEGLFEQMLLENAINFEDWKEALRVRLTIDRLVQEELTDKVRISEEELAAHYRSHDPKTTLPEAEAGGSDRMDRLLVEQLRRQKTEEAYGPWIETLRSRYAVAIDHAVVQDIMTDSGLDATGAAERNP